MKMNHLPKMIANKYKRWLLVRRREAVKIYHRLIPERMETQHTFTISS